MRGLDVYKRQELHFRVFLGNFHQAALMAEAGCKDQVAAIRDELVGRLNNLRIVFRNVELVDDLLVAEACLLYTSPEGGKRSRPGACR